MKQKPTIVHSHDIHLDSEYVQWLCEIKQRYQKIQIKTAIKVNSEQLLFYWQLGRDLDIRKATEKWGSGIIEQVSLDLQSDFPTAKGFSTRNLWNIKKWYLFYTHSLDNMNLLKEAGNHLSVDEIKLHQIGAVLQDTAYENLKSSVTGMDFPPLFGFVPWRHHVEIITKCKSVKEAIFYLQKTIEENWSRNALINYLNNDYYHNSGHALTNFEEKLPQTQGKLAQEMMKETYDLGFITLDADYGEEALEEALERNITHFLLELGTGFAFVGRQKEIIVSGKLRRIDMLFYHIKLKCYVVVELKVRPFEPEFVGKLNFYVNAIDELLKTEAENPTIGLLICKDVDQTEVKWAFQGIQTPMGVAKYNNIAIKEIQEQLPTTEQIQTRIQQAAEEFNLKKYKQDEA